MAPIHASAQMGCLNCLKWMVQDQGVDINILDGDEATPLHFAASRGHSDTVRWLLRHGARITHDKYGKTPMNDAAENKQLEVLSLLVEHSGDEGKSWASKSDEGPCSCTSSKSSTGSKDAEPFYLHPPNDDRSRRKKEGASEESDHQYEAIPEDTNMKDGGQRLGNGYAENGHSKLARVCAANAPPPPPLPPPDLMTPAAPRRLVERRNSTDSINSINTMLSAEFGRIDNESQDGEVHVLKPSELAKGKKRKNVPKEDGSDELDNDDDFVPLAPKPGAHMVLPFIPPKFSSLNREGNSLIKPSEYLKSINKNGSLPRGPAGIPDFGQYDETSSQSSSESGIDSPGSSLPSSGVSPPLPATHLPVIKEDDDIVAWTEGVPPPPPPPPGPPAPPPPPPPPHATLKATQSAPATVERSYAESKSTKPQASMAISMRELQSVQLKKTDGGGGRQHLDKTVSDPLSKLLIPNAKKGFGTDTKGDLIAELKLSHTIGGVGKLRSEQHKAQDEAEKEQYRKFLGQFTAENFLKKIPSSDPAGNEIPKWKREMLAKKAADKAKQESLDERARLEEERKMQAIPAWKRQLLAQKDGDVKRVDDEIVINGEVYVRKSSSVISSSIDNIQEKLERKNAENMIRNGSDIRQDDTDGFPMSVPLLKQKLRNASIGRVSNGVEIGMEPVQSGVFVDSTVQENVMEEEHQETAQQRNNTFMTRNVKVREWSAVSRENVNGEEGLQTDMVAQKEEKKMSMTNTNIIAKEAEAVDTLRRKLEMRKLESKQETFGSNHGVVLRKNEKSVFQNGYDEYEVKFYENLVEIDIYFFFNRRQQTFSKMTRIQESPLSPLPQHLTQWSMYLPILTQQQG
eukprot:TRINITY_DN8023_c0_g1_i4.p1 TRINITY_DN8023_c0_g1~~TRINITY_DN8023_c0_g1_i4.p1  ORF type:complete len:984 (-),score=275.70 TRINITY_DN8023_c0_g1_i4:1081-3648(-)